MARWLDEQSYYTLVDCNPVTPLFPFVVDSLYNSFPHCCAAVGKILTASRGPFAPAVAVLLVISVGKASEHPGRASAMFNYYLSHHTVLTRMTREEAACRSDVVGKPSGRYLW